MRGLQSGAQSFSIQLGRDFVILNEEVMSAQIDHAKGKAAALKAGAFFSLADSYI